MKNRQGGSILVTILIMMPFFMLSTIAYLQLSTTGFRVARSDQFHTHAQLAADAAIDFSMQALNQDTTWAGTVGEVTLHDDGNVKTTYQAVINSVDANHKTIVATGRTYHPVTATAPDRSVTINVALRPVRAGEFSIVTGVGGLYLSNSAKVLGGDVFVNGELSMQNSSQIGLSTNPANLKVANQNCPSPPDATYPRICNPAESSQPISIANTAHIYGNVSANNQVSGSNMSNNGLVATSGVATQALPTHDRPAQKAAITTSRTGADASCTTNNGTKTWAAHTKITGNVQIDRDCTVTIEGDVWITGNLSMTHSKAKLKVSNSVGATKPIIMIDGPTSVFQNGSAVISNSSSTGAHIIAYWSKASCSPECASVTGSDLYNSRSSPTITFSQTSSGPNTIFYARWTKILVENSGAIGALIGQTVELQNSGSITFGTSIGIGSTYWLIDGYRRVF